MAVGRAGLTVIAAVSDSTNEDGVRQRCRACAATRRPPNTWRRRDLWCFWQIAHSRVKLPACIVC